jgi:sugar phosphate isomerase/epimerase
MKRMMIVLGAMLAFQSHAAPKIFPYCVKSSPAELKALGYDGCEIPFVVGTNLEQRIKAADDAKMTIAKTYIMHDIQKPFPVEKLEAFMAQLKGRETVIELALTGYPAGAPEGVEPTVRLLKELGALAAKYQLRIALYNHIKTYCESVPFALEIVNKVNLPNVGYCFIVCHWLHMEGAKDYRPLLKANSEKLFMVGTNGATVELKGWNNLICPLDVGNFDNGQLLQTLDEINYKGLVGLQCFGIKLPEPEHLKRSIDTWKKLTVIKKGE